MDRKGEVVVKELMDTAVSAIVTFGVLWVVISVL